MSRVSCADASSDSSTPPGPQRRRPRHGAPPARFARRAEQYDNDAGTDADTDTDADADNDTGREGVIVHYTRY
eukprot:gene1962-592_t